MGNNSFEYKIAMVSTILPETHYSQYLTQSLSSQIPSQLFVFTDTNYENLKVKKSGKIILTWDKNAFYPLQILIKSLQHKPTIVHFQHELNMFGGYFTSVIFPVAIVLLKIFGIKIVTTVHAVVSKKDINNTFIHLFFNKPPILIRPRIVTIFFTYLYSLICLLSNKIIVHTETLKEILIKDYHVSNEKIIVIPHGVPAISNNRLSIRKKSNEKYLLYFGYISKRKGIDELLKGFASYIHKNYKSNLKLKLAGGVIKGQEFARVEIEEIITKLKIQDNVEIIGFVSQVELSELFKNSLAVVIPAKISIAASGPLAQAMAYGKPILISDLPNIRAEFKGNNEVLLVQKKEWCKNINEIVTNHRLQRQLSTNIKKKAESRSWNNVAKMHINLYKSIHK